MVHSVIYLALAIVGAASAYPLDQRALIEQALDEPTKIVLENIALGQAIDLLTEQTGVKITMSASTMSLVPGGADMNVRRVDIANIPLRVGLQRLFSPLGMKCVVRDRDVEVVPKRALLCLGRAPTWPELELLEEVSGLALGADAAAFEQLRPKIQFRIPMTGAWKALTMAVRDVGAGPGDEVLTIACENLGWAWCLSGDRVVVTSREKQIAKMLDQPVSLRMNYRPLVDVLAAVGKAANVDVRTAPGTLASLPIQMQQSFSINVQRQPAAQVLESIASATGLGFLIDPSGVLFFLPEGERPESRQSRPPRDGGDPYVAKIVVPSGDGRTMEWLIRMSELPPDLQQMRERDIAEVIEALRQRRDAKND